MFFSMFHVLCVSAPCFMPSYQFTGSENRGCYSSFSLLCIIALGQLVEPKAETCRLHVLILKWEKKERDREICQHVWLD